MDLKLALSTRLLFRRNIQIILTFFCWEGGIGKTSLLNVAQMFARGEHKWGDYLHNFISVRLSLDDNSSLVDFSLSLKKAIEREIDKGNVEMAVLKKAWNFVSKFEAAGISYKKEEVSTNNAQLIQDFTYSLVDTVKALREPTLLNRKDGLGKERRPEETGGEGSRVLVVELVVEPVVVPVPLPVIPVQVPDVQAAIGVAVCAICLPVHHSSNILRVEFYARSSIA